MGSPSVSAFARRRARAPLAVMAAVTLLTAAAMSAGPDGGRPSAATGPTLREFVGQRLVVAFRGTAASRALLARVRRGEVGGVIVFGGNVTSAAQLGG